MRTRTSLTLLFVSMLLAACGGGGGGGGGGEPPSDPNSAPTADGQDTETSEDIAVSITLLGSDADGSVASYQVTDEPDNGTLSGTAPDLTYTPNADFEGTDSFQFTVTDNDGAESSPATVGITIHSINDAPTALEATVTTDEDTPVSVTLQGTDIDGEIIDYIISTPPANGRLSGEPPDLEYNPYPNKNGGDIFEFYVEDDQGAFSDPVQFLLNVTAVQDAPQLFDQWVRVRRNITSDIPIVVKDPEQDGLTLEITEEPSHGAATIDGTTVVFDAENGYVGEDSIRLVATDFENNTSEEATLTITIVHLSKARDREYLTDIFHATGGESSWLDSTNWGSEAHPKDWFGVTVHRGAFLEMLDLPANGLAGALPSKLGAIGYPVAYDLSGNLLSGSFMGHLTALEDLTMLNLAENSNIDGEFPRVWNLNKSLSVLDVSQNQMEGTLPVSWRELENLSALRLSGNSFSGWPVPGSLPTSLTILDLADNNFEGPVPSDIALNQSLERLSLEDSGFTGRLPLELMNLKNLTQLWFEGVDGDLCAPASAEFQDWLASIQSKDLHTCDTPGRIVIDRVLEMRNVTAGVTDTSTKLEIENRGDSPLELTITTSASWLSVSLATLTIDGFDSASLTVTVDCGDASRRIGTVTIASNDPDRPTRVIEVDVKCLERDLGIEFTNIPTNAGGGPFELNFTDGFAWEMTSSTEDSSPEPYTVEFTSPENTSIALPWVQVFEGIVSPGENIDHQISGVCLAETSVTATVKVTIGNLTAEETYTVSCGPEVARVEALNWYQVPWVATETITYSGTAITGGEKSIEHNAEVFPERRAVVSFVVAHGYRDPISLGYAQWENSSSGSNTNLEEAIAGTTEKAKAGATGPSEGLLPWNTSFHFHLDAGQMTDVNDETLILDTVGLSEQFRSPLVDLEFADVATFLPVWLPFVAEQGDPPDPAPDWDDDELLRETRWWLPIGDDDPRRYDTIWLDPADLTGTFNDNYHVLDLTLDYWNDEGEEDEFFHGLLLSNVNNYYCGGGVAYLSWQVGQSCIRVNPDGAVTGGRDVLAHEFGHNFSRPHAPCGVSGDPDYPYPDGRIGPPLAWSYWDDQFVNIDFVVESGGEEYVYHSHMSYCGPWFASDYDYAKMSEYYVDQSEVWADAAASEPQGFSGNEPRSIALIARLDLDTGEWRVLQSKFSRKLPRPGREGDHTLVILDTHGNESHRQPIQLGERHLIDANGNPGPEDRQRTWVARVPIPALGIGSIKVLDPADTEMLSTTIKLDP